MANLLREFLDDGGYKGILQKVLRKMHVDEKGCWIWEGCTDSKTGYGHINIFFGKKVKVHRFIAYCFHGLDLFDLQLQACHTCDIRNCINPFHIWVGTKSENFLDSSRKGRWHSGGGRNPILVNHLTGITRRKAR